MEIWEYWLISGINVVTSMLTAITGMGGGTVLVAILPMFLPSMAVIPVHGATQLASNVSRAYLSREMIEFTYVKPFALGALVGVAVFGSLVRFISLELVPLFIACYILLTQWSKTVNHLLKNIENFYIIGFVQMGMVLFVGAAGPMHMPLLLKKYDNSHMAVTVGSLMMSLAHAVKIGVYVWLGFSFLAYWQLIVMMIVAASVGSWLGVRARQFVPADKLKKLLPWLLTVMALKLIIDTVLKQGWLG